METLAQPARYPNRHGAAAPVCELVLSEERLSAEAGGKLVQAVRLDAVTSVRLSIEMAGRDTQIVCRVSGPSGAKVVFGSKRWTGPGQWTEQARDFQMFLAGLHAALKPRWDQITFREGQSLAFKGVVFASALILTGTGVLIGGWMLLADNPAGLFALVPIVAGAWLAVLFRPVRPKAYDPAAYARL